MKNSNIQFPAQNGVYAVKVKNGRHWADYHTARFHISVGQDYHEGDKFKATMEWAKHRFERVIVCVNDTLQRYNYIYQDKMLPEQAFLLSEEKGREWIERNLSAIRTVPQASITRWDNWRNASGYQDQYDEIIHLHMTRSDMREMISAEIMEFWKRRQQKNSVSGIDFDKFKKMSTDYLLEETAVFFMMFKKDIGVDVYPGSVLLPCVLAQKYLGDAAAHNLGERAFTRIDFSRNLSQQPQNSTSPLQYEEVKK